MNSKYIISHQSLITQEERRQYYQQESKVIWFTGLSGSGKTTLATSLEKKLIAAGKITCLLDGDSLRQGLNSDLDFSDNARKENIRRIAELATYLGKQGMIVLVSAISPHRTMRQFAREQAKAAGISFVEIYVKATLQTCQARDPKQLYQAAINGTVQSLSGMDSVYEEPEHSELIIDTDHLSVEESTDLIFTFVGI